MVNKKVYIVILNWNGWKDTIECLESVFRSDYPNYTVVVCDNASGDHSLDHIKRWADGKEFAHVSSHSRIARNTYPYKPKPIPYVEYDRCTAEAGGNGEMDSPLVLIRTGGNLGFAGGNNVGIRYALARGDFAYIWFLNNDTVVEGDALTNLVGQMTAKKTAGIGGSTILYYHCPDKIQALGGATYNKSFGTSKHIGTFLEYKNENLNQQQVEETMDYVMGASMIVSRAFIDTVGLMSEAYFLYYEEIDWATRGKEWFTLAFSPQSIVYHKEGASIGSASDPKEQSSIADYYIIRNRIVFTRKYYPRKLVTVYIGIVLALLNRIRRRQWNRIPMIIKIMMDCLRKSQAIP
ncbi:hypothetical protein P22_0537 [Propionispora sp. 2/2-37]|uniref:glycosyltransferase family 2 protein n=1 Tax=Propionispora sp. 2/2-37 TaxID=1677858 RepID=UPI0006BB7698|nr:glycosyltransferase family 2 protein [Propionispora sp. 2/2-37]CUH94471.1 hypothetical protein P22_0537 [Propionispora sp. 2/2-37]